MKKISVLLVVLAIACTKKDEPMVISDPTIELKYDGTHQYTIKKGAEPVANSSIQWQSSDELVGTIDKNGLFEGRKIGKTDVIASTDDGTLKASVEIVPYSTLMTEPAVDFGQSKQTVKSKEKRKLSDEDTDYMVYDGENSKVEMVMYLFENNKLTTSAAILSIATDVVKESVTFYNERYPINSIVDEGVVFFNEKKTVGIFLTVDEDLGLVAVYTQNTSGKRTNITAKTRAEIMKILKQSKAKK